MPRHDIGASTPPPRPPRPSVLLDDSRSLTEALDELRVPTGRPVIVIIGWAGSECHKNNVNACQEGSDKEVLEKIDKVKLLLETAVARACRDESPVVVTGGTNAGVMALVGQVLAEHAPDTILLGIAPNGMLLGYGAPDTDPRAAHPEPHHSLLRVQGTRWGDEAATLVRAVERIAVPGRLLVIAIGGGSGTEAELLLAGRRHWPVLLISGCGGASEQLLATANPVTLVDSAKGRPRPGKSSADAKRAEYSASHRQEESADTRPATVPIGEREVIERTLRWRLSGNLLLRDAWTRFADADEAAMRAKPKTLVLALTVTVLASLTAVTGVLLLVSTHPPSALQAISTHSARISIKVAATALPLLAAVFLLVIDKRSRTGTWVEMRAAAETLLRDIYRARAMALTRDGADISRLRDTLRAMDERTGGRLAAAARQEPETWPHVRLQNRIPTVDSLFGPLAGATYDQARVADQMQFMRSRTRSAERLAFWVSLFMFTAAATAAFLLSLSWRWEDSEVYAAVVASVAAAFASWRGYRRYENQADAFRATLVAVRIAQGRWRALPAERREQPEQVGHFIEEVEIALTHEGSEWERSLRQAQNDFAEEHRNSA